MFGSGSVKLVDKKLLTDFGTEVLIGKGKCDMCGEEFLGTYHNDPMENPIEEAISLCGKCDVVF